MAKKPKPPARRPWSKEEVRDLKKHSKARTSGRGDIESNEANRGRIAPKSLGARNWSGSSALATSYEVVRSTS